MMDFSAVCRTCLGTDSLKSIFGKFGDSKKYSTVIFVATGVKVEVDDGLPQLMCAHCLYTLNNTLKFRQICKLSETKLLGTRNESNEVGPKVETAIDDFESVDDVKDIKVELESEANDIIDYSAVITKSEVETEQSADEISNVHLTNKDTPSRPRKNVKKTRRKVRDRHARVQCTLCQKDLSIHSLDGHMMKTHPVADVRREKCEQCDSYIVREKMNRHVLMMHRPKKFRCKSCNSEYTTRKSLADHARACPANVKRKVVRDKSREVLECEVCHKRMQRASLKAHVAVKHAGLGPVCEHCGRRFGNKLRLSEHLRAKHGHEKFKCSSCEFTSSSTTALQNHERRHRGEKPFVCEECGAKFHAAYLLAQHRHSHRTEKRVRCTLCSAVFKTGNSLNAHRHTVHGAALHRCTLCARAYSCRHYAVKHLRSVHLFKGPVPPLQVVTNSNEL